MKPKPLTETNPYLKDKTLRTKLNKRTVRSSCAVEGIKATTTKVTVKIKRRKKELFKKLKAKITSD